jgi:hypothetical protein
MDQKQWRGRYVQFLERNLAHTFLNILPINIFKEKSAIRELYTEMFKTKLFIKQNFKIIFSFNQKITIFHKMDITVTTFSS